jgi:hypothetical protein
MTCQLSLSEDMESAVRIIIWSPIKFGTLMQVPLVQILCEIPLVWSPSLMGKWPRAFNPDGVIYLGCKLVKQQLPACSPLLHQRAQTP